jgi:histidinol dehydrogenase
MIGPIKIRDLRRDEVKRIFERNRLEIQSLKPKVQEILNDIQKNGDMAVLKYTKIYDKVDLSKEKMKVSQQEISLAYEAVSKKIIKSLKIAANNIKNFHKKQLPKEKIVKINRTILVKQVFKPICKIGAYIPRGIASYPSTALMTCIPAKVAGVRKIIACTPPRKNGSADPAILVALDIAGADEIYQVGGVQAIGALTYGTETIEPVDKIVGPGNIYVTTAKMLVYGTVGIDFPAGPSEVLIFADETADPHAVAADMISQAEHGSHSVALLVTTSEKIANSVQSELQKIAKKEKRNIVQEAMMRNGGILIAENEGDALDFINEFAPEHLEIIAKNATKFASRIENSGTILIGKYTPVAVGDYAIGPSHVLPTSGAARFNSGLSVYDFLKIINIQTVTEKGLRNLRKTVNTLAEIEGLPGHKEAVETRFLKGD